MYLDLRKLPQFAQFAKFFRCRGHLLDLVIFLCALKIVFGSLGSTTNFENFDKGWGKNLLIQMFLKFLFLIFMQSQELNPTWEGVQILWIGGGGG